MTGKILVIHTSFLGDAILALPFLQELKKNNPGMAIHVLCSPRGEEIFRHSPVVDNVLILEKFTTHKTLKATLAYAWQLRKYNYDRVYSLHRSLRTSLMVACLGVRDTYGFTTAAFSFIYKHRITYRKDFHEVLRNLMFLQNNRYLENWKIFPEIDSEKYTDKIDLWMSEAQIRKGFIVLAPGSVWATKRYPSEYFVEIAKTFKEQGYDVVLSGGKAEIPLCAEIAVKSGVKDISGLLTIIELKQLLSTSALIITNDSALTHLGMTAGCPVLTIYCSTIPGFGFYPYSEGSSYIGIDDLKCKPCGIHGHRACPEKHFDCGKKMLPNLVIRAAEELLRQGKDENDRDKH